jgi:ribosomal protein L11 methyltransferase
MSAPYLEVTIALPADRQDDVIALLTSEGFDSFWQEEERLKAYTNLLLAPKIEELLTIYGLKAEQITDVPQQNWNQAWEENYPSVSVTDFCHVYPHFREPQVGFQHYLKITPKMSFGTGHHETTRSVIRILQGLFLQGKSVLDMGCGTGILGILAYQMGARPVTWIDNDPQATENCTENLIQNNIHEGRILTGGEEIIPNERFNLIVANIQRNVLLEDGERYASRQEAGDELIVSGFYASDQAEMVRHFNQLNYSLALVLGEADWIALHFTKQTTYAGA